MQCNAWKSSYVNFTGPLLILEASERGMAPKLPKTPLMTSFLARVAWDKCLRRTLMEELHSSPVTCCG